jgi:hypothetical protein
MDLGFFNISTSAKSLAPYRQCSAGKVWPAAEDFGASIVDTAICAKSGELLAGQLLYGDSMHRIYFVRSESDGRERDAETCNLSCQKSSTVVPTR